jgi:5-methylcytosine-specific restriction endonuclease McrA
MGDPDRQFFSTCGTCGAEKERNKSSLCPPCGNAYRQNGRAADPLKWTYIACGKCGADKPRSVSSLCSACTRISARRRYSVAPFSYIKASHDYRARKASAEGSFTKSEWEAIKKKQGGKCAHCKQKKKLTIDHIRPLKRGGSNYAINLQGLCGSCNSRKRDSLDAITPQSLFTMQEAV